jgi:polyhydroxyalkanoate synthesis regulator phasin
MSEISVNIDLQGFGEEVALITAQVVKLVIQPYDDLLDTLEAEGRLSEQERKALRQAVQQQIAQLPYLLAADEDATEH